MVGSGAADALPSPKSKKAHLPFESRRILNFDFHRIYISLKMPAPVDRFFRVRRPDLKDEHGFVRPDSIAPEMIRMRLLKRKRCRIEGPRLVTLTAAHRKSFPGRKSQISTLDSPVGRINFPSFVNCGMSAEDCCPGPFPGIRPEALRRPRSS